MDLLSYNKGIKYITETIEIIMKGTLNNNKSNDQQLQG